MLEQIAEGIPTTGMLDTPIGRLEVSNGYPTEATTKKLFDEMDFQRAVQAYLWALPMIGSAQWQNEQHDKFGAGDLDYVDYLDFKDKLGFAHRQRDHALFDRLHQSRQDRPARC
jgi:hypothetical protein